MKFVPEGPIDKWALFQVLDLHQKGYKPQSEPMMV